jgi:hypothetical protein
LERCLVSVLALASVVSGAAGFELEYWPVAGERSRGSLAGCWSVPFERCRPVRSFPSYRGQSSFSGWWWLATTAEHVGYESWLERDHLIAFDADPDVALVASQPFWIYWSQGGKTRRHAPDYFLRLRDGRAVVIDVRVDERIADRDAEGFGATARACASVGWEYRRVGAVAAVSAANRRWLAGYRHPRCRRPGLVVELAEVFTEPTALMVGAEAVGDPIVVLPTLFHLLWSGELRADLDTALLGASTEVCSA